MSDPSAPRTAIEQLRANIAAVDAHSAMETAPRESLDGLPYWAVTYFAGTPENPGRIFYSAQLRSPTVALVRPSENHEAARDHEPRPRLEPVPVDELRRIASAHGSDPRIRAWAVRFLSEALEPGAVEAIEPALDDDRDAGLFPLISTSEDPSSVLWRRWKVSDLALGAMNFIFGGLQQEAEFTPFTSPAGYRSWRKTHRDLERSIDFQRNRLELASLQEVFYPGQVTPAKDRLKAIAGHDPTLATLLAISRPSYSCYELGEEWANRLFARAFPENRLLKILSNREDLDALQNAGNRFSFRWWLLNHPELGPKSGADLLKAWQAAQPAKDDQFLAVLAARALPAQRLAILTETLQRVDLRGNLSQSFYPYALQEAVLLDDPAVAPVAARFFFDVDTSNAAQVLQAIAKKPPQAAKKLLALLLSDARFARLRALLAEKDAEWQLMQAFLEAATVAGFALPGFNGYVFDTQGRSIYYPPLGESGSPNPGGFQEVRRKLIERIVEWSAQ